MRHSFRGLAAGVAGLVLAASGAGAQEVHEIRMEARGKNEFRFTPSSVQARRGDVLLFRSESGGPHSVVFEAAGLPPDERDKLNAAMPRRAGDLSSPLLTDGTEYRVVIPALTAGTYRFYCLPHRAYDMKGVVTVK
jgi:plastocyanin